MELEEIKTMWQLHEAKLERSLQLNRHCLEMIQKQKVRAKLAPLLWQRTVELALHVLVIGWLTSFLFKNISGWPYAASAIVLILFFGIAFANCLRQVILIKRMDYGNDILTIQSELNRLQIHIVDYVRLTFLCLPTWLAYPIIAFKALTGFDFIARLHGAWWTGNLLFSLLMLVPCLWLYFQVSYRNIHKNWVRKFIQISSGQRVAKAMEFIKEMEALKKST